MLAASYGSVEDIEILWTLLAVAGLFFSLFNLKESIKDRDFLREHSISNGRKLIADTTILAESMRAVKQAVFLSIGVVVLFLPGVDNSTQPLKLVVLGFLIRWGLIAAVALTAGQSFLAFRLRKRLKGG